MSECDTCGTPVIPERALAVDADKFRCQHGCPPKVEFFPEIICEAHKRCTPGSRHCATPPCRDRHYTIDGERTVDGVDIVSVTTITGEIGDKFGQGAWWGQGVGVAGYAKVADLEGGSLPDDPVAVVELLKKHKLTTNHVRDEAATRGTNVHAFAEEWAKTGKMPWDWTRPASEEGYVKAFASFVKTEKVQPIEPEILVGSRRGAYAGQSDLLARFPKLDAVGLVDYKTKAKPLKGKPVAYEQHHLQLRGYMEGLAEMDYPIQPEFGCVVNLYPDGTYALVQGRATAEQWWDALAAYRSLVELRNAIKEAA